MATTTTDSRTDTYTINDVVKDVQIIPYIRSKVVEFYATKMKPNTRVYAFFDGQAVSQFCRDIGFQLSSSNSSTASQLVSYGSPLITDSNGDLYGEFKIPDGRFFTGTREFVLSDDSTLSGDPDMETTRANAVYFAGGVSVDTQTVTLNVVTPTSTRPSTNDSNKSPETASAIPQPSQDCLKSQKKYHPNNYYAICLCVAMGGTAGTCGDPVAQGITLDEDKFVTGIDLYFKSVDNSSDRIFVQIRDMVNGYPGTTVLTNKTFLPSELKNYVSDDSSKAFKVVFDTPVYLQGATQYCFVVGGYSPNTKLWFAETGGTVVNMNGKIVEQQTTAEASFRSLNGNTWNAVQTEQIKFNLYTAVFDTSPMNLVFENDHSDDHWSLAADPFQTQTGQTRIRVFARDHGLTVGDKVSISLFDNVPFTVSITDYVPQVSQLMKTSTGSGYVSSVTPTATANVYTITLINVSGSLKSGQGYTCDSKVRSVRDTELVAALGSQKSSSYILNSCTGTVISDIYASSFPTGAIAGIPVGEFNSEFVSGSTGLSVIEVTNQDAFIINVQTPATSSGRTGGSGISMYNSNYKYDIFNVSGIYLPYLSSESWTLTGIGHGDTGDLFETSNYQYLPAAKITPASDVFLNQPMKMASAVNESIQLGASGKSVSVQASFTPADSTTSPMVNLDTFSITTISNRVESVTKADFSTIPVVSGDPIWYAEEDVSNGNGIYKYVTKTVNLETAANDIHVYLDVYKDLNSDFDIYFKVLNSSSSDSIESQPWIKANNVSKTRSSVDTTDFIEYNIVASEACTAYTSNTVSYTGWPNQPFVAFKVKIVGTSKNSSKPPLFQSLRVIAVT